MNRSAYQVYSPARIGDLTLPTRWVRSATADLAPWKLGRFTQDDVELYRTAAQSGIGLLIVNGPDIVPPSYAQGTALTSVPYSYDDVRIGGTADLVSAIRSASPNVAIMAQIGCNEVASSEVPAGPSPVTSPYYEGRFRELSADEIRWIVNALVQTTAHMKAEGFDGVQLHAAHGGGLWTFLSPHSNRRSDAYGGSAENRVRIVAEIVAGVRRELPGFPVLIKANCTDYLDDGIDETNFGNLAHALERAGVAAIEVSGGTWDALVRSEAELGFRPVPAAESHTGILDPQRQNYFLPFIQGLDLGIPLILVGGIRNVEAAEAIVRSGVAQFVAMCRPLIHEPDLVARWREGHGPAEAACMACNSCIYSMHLPFEKMGRRTVTCLAAHDAALHAEAQHWLSTFIDDIRSDRPDAA